MKIVSIFAWHNFLFFSKWFLWQNLLIALFSDKIKVVLGRSLFYLTTMLHPLCQWQWWFSSLLWYHVVPCMPPRIHAGLPVCGIIARSKRPAHNELCLDPSLHMPLHEVSKVKSRSVYSKFSKSLVGKTSGTISLFQ